MNKFSIPLYKPSLGPSEREALVETFDSTWISSKGPKIAQFEEEVSRFTGSKFGVSTSNGTTALHLAFASLNLKPGDVVLMPTLTYVATATPALNIGLKVRLCDVNPETWMPAESDFQESIDVQTRAIASVDLFGTPSGNWVTDLARVNKLRHVNDGAESLGSFTDGEHAGKKADVNTLSFFANKTITTGEGGMILTDNEELASNSRLLKNQGLNEKSHEYDYSVAGYNFRMTNLTASIGVSQIKRIEEIIREKKRVYRTYIKYLDGTRFTPQKIGNDISSNYWLASFLCPNETIKNRIRATLLRNSIESRPFFKPLNLLPFVEPQPIKFPVSEELWHRGISLPSFPELKEEEIALICELMNSEVN